MNGEHTSKAAHVSEDQRLGFESAFPVLDHNGSNLIMREFGLSKRELFAAMAMQGLAADCEMNDIDDIACDAVKLADALLKELAK